MSAKWERAARERLERGTIEKELDLFERAAAIEDLTGRHRGLDYREALWVTTMLEVAGYRIAA